MGWPGNNVYASAPYGQNTTQTKKQICVKPTVKRIVYACSIPLSKGIMRERLRWLGHVLQMKHDRLQKILLVGQSSRAKRKAGRLRMGWENVTRKI
jgi:hypothetical protein